MLLFVCVVRFVRRLVLSVFLCSCVVFLIGLVLVSRVRIGLVLFLLLMFLRVCCWSVIWKVCWSGLNVIG